jgi:L-threonylcarbamoyladenylate synthase
MLRLPASPRALNARLRAGGLIAYPTRASFGLGCLPNHACALRRLTRLKRRPIYKGMIVVADREIRLKNLMQPLSPQQHQILSEKWPGNWTWLVPPSKKVLPLLRGRHRAIALRIDAYPPVYTLCKRLKTALVSTSANRSGHRPIRSEKEIRKRFGEKVTVISGRCQKGARASTIADLFTGKILRA